MMTPINQTRLHFRTQTIWTSLIERVHINYRRANDVTYKRNQKLNEMKWEVLPSVSQRNLKHQNLIRMQT